mgnify:CR=1 FL=1
MKRLWRCFVFLFAITTSFLSLIIGILQYEPRHEYTAPILSLISLTISGSGWMQTMLAMNHIGKDTNQDRKLVAIIYACAGICNIANGLAVAMHNTVLQFVSALFASVISWTGFLVVFEGDFVVPTTQQYFSLFQSLFVSGLWELRTFVINQQF